MGARSGNLKVMEKILDKTVNNLLRDFFEIENLQNSSTLERFIEVSLAKAKENVLQEIDNLHMHEYDIAMGDEYGINLKKAERKAVWLINLLDGRQNFVRGSRDFAISICAETYATATEPAIPTATVINFPAYQETFYAEQGGGSFSSNRRIRVSNRNRIHLAVVELVNVYRKQKDSLYLPKAIQKLCSIADSQRQCASALTAMLKVAAGKSEIGLIALPKPSVQTACLAGQLLIAEAGGFTRIIQLEDMYYLLFGNSALQTEVQDLLV